MRQQSNTNAQMNHVNIYGKTTSENKMKSFQHWQDVLDAAEVDAWLPCMKVRAVTQALGEDRFGDAIHLLEQALPHRSVAPEAQAILHTLRQAAERANNDNAYSGQMEPPSDISKQLAIIGTFRPIQLEANQLRLEFLASHCSKTELRILQNYSTAVFMMPPKPPHDLPTQEQTFQALEAYDIVPMDSTWWSAQWNTAQYEIQRDSLNEESRAHYGQYAQIVRHIQQKKYRSAVQFALPLFDTTDRNEAAKEIALLATRAAWLAGQQSRAMTMLYSVAPTQRDGDWHRWAMTIALAFHDHQAVDESITYLVRHQQADPIVRLHAAQSLLRKGNGDAAEVHLRLACRALEKPIAKLAKYMLIKLMRAQQRYEEALAIIIEIIAHDPNDQEACTLANLLEAATTCQPVERRTKAQSDQAPAVTSPAIEPYLSTKPKEIKQQPRLAEVSAA